MKIYCTGTTRGLGKGIEEYFTKTLNYEVIGLNRPNLDLSKSLDGFIKDDFDVYINNAYFGWAQTDLLYKLWEINKDRKCMIINIGSVCVDRTYDRAYPYALHKIALYHACLQLQQAEAECKILHIKMGRMDTDFVSHRQPPKLPTAFVAEQISNLIHLPSFSFLRELTIDNHFAKNDYYVKKAD